MSIDFVVETKVDLELEKYNLYTRVSGNYEC